MAGEKVQSTLELKAQVRELREKIVAVIAEMDDIRLQQIPAIQADYAVRVGCWETQLLEAELACRRAKRKLALMQARVNDGLEVQSEQTDSYVEAMLDTELAEWRDRLAQLQAKQQMLLASVAGSSYLTPPQSRRLKELYRTLVKRLHPDLHPAYAERFEELFATATRAYKAGQLDVLRALEVSTRALEQGDADLEGLSESELAMAVELTQIELEAMERDLAALKADPIFELKRNMADAAWLSATVASIKAKTAEFDEARMGFEARLAKLVETGR